MKLNGKIIATGLTAIGTTISAIYSIYEFLGECKESTDDDKKDNKKK